MQKCLRISFFVLSISLFFSFATVIFAQGMQIKPGLWETKSVVTTPGGTHENTTQDCIEKASISPERMMDDNEGCTVTDSSTDASSMQWSIYCENQGVAMNGDGKAQSTGDSITGGMDIKANFNGQEMVMTTSWEGKRVGDCK